jgi:hypothetical protein
LHNTMGRRHVTNKLFGSRAHPYSGAPHIPPAVMFPRFLVSCWLCCFLSCKIVGLFLGLGLGLGCGLVCAPQCGALNGLWPVALWFLGLVALLPCGFVALWFCCLVAL